MFSGVFAFYLHYFLSCYSVHTNTGAGTESTDVLFFTEILNYM
jgi:hypothetical protein